MNQERFLAELAHLLQDLPEDEREEALEFYRCYFEDAGIENEAAVMEELGSPEKVAYTIRESLNNSEEQGEYTENGYHTYEDKKIPATLDADENNAEHDTAQAEEQDYYRDARIFEEQKRRREESDRSRVEQERQRQQAEQERQRQQTDSQTEQERCRRRDENIQRHNQRTRRLLLFPFWLIAVIIMIIVMVVVISVVVAVAGALAIGIFTAWISGIGMLVIGAGIAAGGAVFAGIAVLGLGLLAIAIGVLLILALVAFCKKPLPAVIRAICNATGSVISSLSGR